MSLPRMPRPARLRLVRCVLVILLVPILTSALAPSASAELVALTRKISGDLSLGGSVLEFDVSPDGQFAVYRAYPSDPEDVAVPELFSVALEGGDPVKLNHALPPESYVINWEISPDSQRVVYAVCPEPFVYAMSELYSVPIAGGSATRLNSASMGPDDRLYDWTISPDGQRVAYVAEHVPSPPSTRALFSVPIGGGPVVWLAGFPVSCPTCRIDYEFTPNGVGVVVYKYLEIGTGALSVVYATGGAETVLALNVVDWRIAPNNAGVVYEAKESDSESTALFARLFAGDAPVQLTTGTEDSPKRFSITPNSLGVVYRLDLGASGHALYAVPSTGGATPVQLTPLAADTWIPVFHITPNSLGVVYVVGTPASTRYALRAVSILGDSPPVNLTGSLRDEAPFAIMPNSLGVVYAEQDAAGGDRLYAAVIDGSARVALSPQLPPGGMVYDLTIRPDSRGVVYAANQDREDVTSIYAVASTGGAPLFIDEMVYKRVGMMITYRHWWRITPNNAVVYMAQREATTEAEPEFDLFLAHGTVHKTYVSLVRTEPE